MPIPVFAFEQLPFGEATKSKRRDVHGFGRAIEDEFDKARARGGGGLEACAAQPAGEIKPVQPRGAVDGALVGRDAVAPHVDGVQAALFDFRDALYHLVNQFFNERGRGRLVFGVGWLAAQGLVFAGGQDECAAFGTEVAVDDVVDHGRESSQRGRTVEESHIMSPGLERDVQSCEACDLLGPRSGRVHQDRRGKIASTCADTCHLAS